MTIHLLANADFTVYQYSSVYIPGGVTAVLNGESVTVPAGSGITLPIGLNTATGSSGAFFLLGKKKPESFKDVDGNYPFLGK
tara:strand:+ start:1264 stop:1509 length:246 start_codon:yes stop_codon:yes gene_type:complete